MDLAELTAVTDEAADAGETRVVLRGVSWSQYEALLGALGDDHPGVRLAYLEGAVEIMSPSRLHEALKSMVGRLLEIYALEREVPLYGFGSATFKKKALERGVEPDECYVITENLRADPEAPDLAIEVVLSSWRLDRLSLYAGLGVKELWLIGRDGQLVIHVLGRGRYRRAAKSRLLPRLDLAQLMRFAVRRDQPRAVREYRDALRRGGR